MTKRKSAEEWFAEGCRYDADKSQRDRAIAAYKESIKLDGSSIDAYVRLGLLLLEARAFEDALSCFKKATDLEPQNAALLNNVAYTYERMERLGTARQIYGRILELKPDDWGAAARIAHSFEAEGDYHSAVEYFEKAISIAPNNPVPRFGLASLYDRYDMFDEAIADYEATLEIDPYHTQALFRIANLYLQEGQYRRAIQFYKRFLLLVPDEKVAWNNLGSAYEGMEDFARAEKAFRHVLTLDPCHQDANYGLAKARYLQGWQGLSDEEKKDVIRRLHFILSLDPNNHEAESLVRCLENER